MFVSVSQGSKGLSLFYAEVSRGEDGRLKGIEVQRLKEKLGTRQMPTAELLLDGLPAYRVSYTRNKLWTCALPVADVLQENQLSSLCLWQHTSGMRRTFLVLFCFLTTRRLQIKQIKSVNTVFHLTF